MKFRLVSSDSIRAVNVKVLNIVTEKSAVSNADGEFAMEVKPEQMLVFPSENYEYKRYLIQEEDIQKRIVTIVLIPKAVQLDEVTVNKDLDLEDLSLVAKGQRKYTPQERRMATAVSGSAVNLASNLVSGRIKLLRKQVRTEKKEALMSRMEVLFEDSFYTQRLKIPGEYVTGFQYFCLDDSEVETALLEKDKLKLQARIAQLALPYLEMVAQEEKENKTDGKP